MNRYDVMHGKSTVAFSDFNIERANLVNPPVYESLLTEIDTNSNGDVSSVRVCNDISLLFNQQRLDKLGAENVKRFLDGLAPRSTSLSELRKKISDADLIKVCKSRYIQSASELLSWSDYLNANYEHIVDSIKMEHELNNKKDVPDPTSDPTSEPTTPTTAPTSQS